MMTTAVRLSFGMPQMDFSHRTGIVGAGMRVVVRHEAATGVTATEYLINRLQGIVVSDISIGAILVLVLIGFLC